MWPKKSLSSKIIILTFLLISLVTTTVTYRTFLSFRQQSIMTFDFNGRRFNLATDEFIDDIITDLPNISATTIPLKSLKAFYLRETRKDTISAISLFKKAIKDNPYIKIPETELSRMYFDQSKIDSAIYYGKKAFFGLPKNPLHFGHYAAALAVKGDTAEINRAYEYMDFKSDKLINKLYLVAMTGFTDQSESNKFLQSIEYLNVKDDEYKISYYILKHGRQRVINALELGQYGDKLFETKKYKEASLKYVEAIKKNPSESAFYQNAGNSFLQVGDYDKADFYLKKAIDSFNDLTGKSEYLYSLSLLEQKNKLLGCQYAKESYNKFKYKDALFLYNGFCRN